MRFCWALARHIVPLVVSLMHLRDLIKNYHITVENENEFVEYKARQNSECNDHTDAYMFEYHTWNLFV